MKNLLTLALDGEVALDQFTEALSNFRQLLNELTVEIAAQQKIEWVIDQLYGGSAVTILRGASEEPVEVENVINAYEKVGEALASGSEIPYSKNVRKFAYNITDILNGKITSIRFETPEKDYLISSKSINGEKTLPIKYSLGTVKGIIETLSKRRNLSFTIWDSLFDKPVNCYFKEGEEEKMRDAWGKRAIVSGRIGRQPMTGRPIVIREVRQVRIIKEYEADSYKNARGVFDWKIGDEPAEKTVRRARDA